MSFVFSFKDNLRHAVEAATGGRNTVLYDDLGNPSIMVRIPKFKIEDIDPGLGSGIHPAFIVDGVEKSEIFIGQFPARVIGGRACSLPGQIPTVSVNYDQAKSYCSSKGSGWHLMTVHEWAAIVLWCMKNGYQPRGNTNWGRSHEAYYETAVRGDNGQPGSTSGDGKTLTGSGPNSWRHDNSPAGISDLVGLIWEWLLGMKIVDGRIYLTQDNNYFLDEASWYATGVYFNSSAAGDSSSSGDIGDPDLADSVTNYAGPQGDNGYYAYTYISAWKNLQNNSTSGDVDLLKKLLIAPTLTGTGELLESIKGALWVRNYGERMPIRGGRWANSSNAGLAALYLANPRSGSNWSIGFRPAFVG